MYVLKMIKLEYAAAEAGTAHSAATAAAAPPVDQPPGMEVGSISQDLSPILKTSQLHIIFLYSGSTVS